MPKSLATGASWPADLHQTVLGFVLDWSWESLGLNVPSMLRRVGRLPVARH
jgi:hypothetical protein